MIPAIAIICAALGLVFLYSGILRKKNLHTILEMRNERSKLEKEYEEALAERKRLLGEVEELDDKLKNAQSRSAAVLDDTGGYSPPPTGEKTAKDPKAKDKAASSWLLKSGQLSLEQYEKVEAYIARSSKEINFLSACLILGLIDKEAADQARRQVES